LFAGRLFAIRAAHTLPRPALEPNDGRTGENDTVRDFPLPGGLPYRPKTRDLIVTGTVPDGWRTRPRST
jgi:hypothetical protein